MMPNIIAIIEQNYFTVNEVEYHDFMVLVDKINGFEIENSDLRYDEDVILNCTIYCIDNVIGGAIVVKSKNNAFEQRITTDLKEYFNIQNESKPFLFTVNEVHDPISFVVGIEKDINLWNPSIIITGICLSSLLLIISILYHILSGCCSRIRSEPNVSWKEYFQLLEKLDLIMLILTICLEISDIIASFLFGLQLLKESKSKNISELQYFGLCFVLLAFCGLITNCIKTLLTRSIFGNHQFIKAKNNLNSNKQEQKNSSLSLIRKFKRDIIVMDWFTIAVEDIPSITIILNMNHAFAIEIRHYSAISFLLFCITIISIMFKILVKLLLNETGLLNPTTENYQQISNISNRSIQTNQLQMTQDTDQQK
eukprot:277459_1